VLVRIVIVLLIIAVISLLVERFRGGRGPVAKTATRPAARTVDVAAVVAYANVETPTIRVRTTRDVLPGGYSAAMAPILIDWNRSDLTEGDATIMIRNVNAGGNPVSGVTVLRTVRLHPDKVSRVEWVLVPLGGPRAISHGQLRFVFEEGGAEFVQAEHESVGEPEVLEDLVLSWEAWRPPGVDYDMVQGLDHNVYELSLRAYSGPQRFLEDALGKRDWENFTLQLPGGRAGLVELLLVSLALGDGAARHSIGWMLDRAEDAWVASGPSNEREGGDAIAEWRELRDRMRSAGAPTSDERIDMRGKTGYQTLLRSCATMALYAIDVTVSRLIERGVTAEGMRPTREANLEEDPEWMTQMAGASVAGLVVRAPRTLEFVIANPASIPGKIPGMLDKAGLLVREGDEPVSVRYSMDTVTPWGRPDQILIR